MATANLLVAISDYFVWWQIPLVLVMVLLVVFLMIYRRRQM